MGVQRSYPVTDDLHWFRCEDIVVNDQRLNQEKVDDFIDMLSCAFPPRLPPVTVRLASVGPVLVDGRHRLAARKHLGIPFILARITL